MNDDHQTIYKTEEEQLFVVEKVWPDLEDDEIAEVLARLPESGSFEKQLSRSARPLSAASLVQTSAGRLFVKRHAKSIRSVDQLQEEHAFSEHLRSRGFSVPRALRFDTGATALSKGPWSYEVLEAAAGEDRYRDAHTWSPFQSAADARAAGSALGRLHKAAADFHAPPRSTDYLQSRFSVFRAGDPKKAVREFLGRSEALADFVSRRPFERDFDAHLKYAEPLVGLLDGIPSSWTHGDWHSSNLFWKGAEVVEVIDFGLSDLNFAIYDIAVAIERNAFLWLDILAGSPGENVRLDLADALIAGYESERKLDDRERAALPLLFPLVQSEFALSSIAYYWGVEREESRAAWAYDVFFNEHSFWFDSAAGRVVLAWFAKRLGA